jgi:hypothetical protein
VDSLGVAQKRHISPKKTLIPPYHFQFGDQTHVTQARLAPSTVTTQTVQSLPTAHWLGSHAQRRGPTYATLITAYELRFQAREIHCRKRNETELEYELVKGVFPFFEFRCVIEKGLLDRSP